MEFGCSDSCTFSLNRTQSPDVTGAHEPRCPPVTPELSPRQRCGLTLELFLWKTALQRVLTLTCSAQRTHTKRACSFKSPSDRRLEHGARALASRARSTARSGHCRPFSRKGRRLFPVIAVSCLEKRCPVESRKRVRVDRPERSREPTLGCSQFKATRTSGRRVSRAVARGTVPQRAFRVCFEPRSRTLEHAS